MRFVFLWAGVVLAAVLGLAVFSADGSPAAFLERAFLLYLVIGGAVVDARRRVIPNAVCAGVVAVHGAFLGACALLGVMGLPAAAADVAASVLGAVALGGGLLGFTLAYESLTQTPQALGGGDIKLVFALGFALGLGRGLLAIALACAVFAGYAGVLALRDAACGRPPQQARAFGPALAAGAYLVLLAC